MNIVRLTKIVIENARELFLMPLVGELKSKRSIKMFSIVSMPSKFINRRALSLFLPYSVAKNIKRII